jgi:hypothetical protein
MRTLQWFQVGFGQNIAELRRAEGERSLPKYIISADSERILKIHTEQTGCRLY